MLLKWSTVAIVPAHRVVDVSSIFSSVAVGTEVVDDQKDQVASVMLVSDVTVMVLLALSVHTESTQKEA